MKSYFKQIVNVIKKVYIQIIRRKITENISCIKCNFDFKMGLNPLHSIKTRQIENRKRIRTKNFDVQNICKHDLHFCYHGCNFGAKCKLEKKIKDDALPLLFWPPCLCRDYVRLRVHIGANFVTESSHFLSTF